MSATDFLAALQTIIKNFEDTQLETIDQVAQWVAEAVAVERFGVLFGTGHSYIPTTDTFPRIGSYPAWIPIHELSVSYMATISGNQGLRQAIFLEKVPGFAEVVMENYRLDPRDVMIVISNSGVNPMPVEAAMYGKQMGMKTVAITSVAHSSASESRLEGGERLFEVCDLTIDTCVPQGDALVQVPGFGAKVAAASTIMGSIVMQSLAAQVAQKLSEKGISLPVYPSHNAKLSPEEHDRIEKMAEDVMTEYSRRTANLFK